MANTQHANNFIHKTWGLFDRKGRRELVLLLLLILFGTCLEILGVGAIVPFVALLGKPDLVETNEYVGHAYEFLHAESMNELLIWAGLAMMVVYLMKNGYLLFMTFFQSRFLNGKVLLLASGLFKSYLHRPYSFHLQRNSAQMLRNLGIISSVMQGIVNPLMNIFTESTVMMGLFIFLVWVEPYSALFVLVTLGLFMSVYYLLVERKLRTLGEAQKYHSGKTIQQVHQGLGSIKETKILGREDFFSTAYQQHLREITQAAHYQQVVSQIPRYYIEGVVVTLILGIMVLLLSRGKDPQSVLIALSLYGVVAIRLMPSIGRIGGAVATIKFYIPNLEEVYGDIVGSPSPPQTGSQEDVSGNNISFEREISLKNIVYRYDNAEEAALDGISLSIRKRSTVGFVGQSGAGKTTTVDVILGLLKPSAGKVLVDGHDIHDGLPSWQRQIGYIPQEIYLSDDTIQGNVALGLPEGEIEEGKVWAALRSAQVEAFVRSLPDGLNTMVGEHGTRLSGGQRQRIGIARALYHEPELLVMDEATASLDNETERALMEAIQQLSGKKTIILIAHRLTTVHHCDTIFFLAEGRLVASGSYDELLEKSAEFCRMAGIGKGSPGSQTYDPPHLHSLARP